MAHQVLRLTTQELTLNLTGIDFPNPAKQGDVLNISGIKFETSVSTKCQQGYYFEGGSCKLADILLMQNLDSSNLIVGNLNIEEVK